jgi:hypothetical protein
VWFDLEGEVAVCCEQSYEISISVQGMNFLISLLTKKESVLWHQLTVRFIRDFNGVALPKPFTVSFSRRALVPLNSCIPITFAG